MDEQLVSTLTHGEYKAEIFSSSVPGEFRVAYQDPAGKVLEEASLTGISSYKQRANEVADRLRQLAEGAPPRKIRDLGDAGEY